MKQLLHLVLLCSALVISLPVSAEEGEAPTVKEVLEQETKEIDAVKEVAEELKRNPDDRSTPRRALLGVAAALDAGDYEKAAEYLDMRYLPDSISPEDGPRLIKHLAYVFNRHIWIDIATLSDAPEGHADDDLPSYRDLFGEIPIGEEMVPLYMQRIPDGQGGREWKISNATVAAIPRLWDEYGQSEFAEQLSDELPLFTYMGIDNWQWAYLGAFLTTLLVVVTVLYVGLGLVDKQRSNYAIISIRRFLLGPLGFFLYIVLLREFMLSLGLSVKARAIFDSVVLAYLAYIFLTLGVIELVAERIRRRMLKGEHPEAEVIVRPVSAVIKMIAVAVLIVMGLDNAGYDVTTIIAGLGVSSVAIALAAQKTLENLIGAITIYIARPFIPGDFCRIGKHLGTVEEIGLRATTLRTLDRSLVNIPNGTLSSIDVENISQRDGIRFLRMIALRLSTSPDQMRYVMARMREILYSHPRVVTETVSVRLYEVNDHALIVRLDCRIDTTDYQRYLAACEDIYLRVIDTVHDSGTEFAFPSQTIMMEEPLLSDEERKAQAEAIVNQWREEDAMPYPDWTDEHVEAINNTLEYPPSGTPYNPRNKDLGADEM